MSCLVLFNSWTILEITSDFRNKRRQTPLIRRQSYHTCGRSDHTSRIAKSGESRENTAKREKQELGISIAF